MKKINIIYIVSTLSKSGVTVQLFNLISNLNLSIFQPSIICLSKENLNSIAESFSQHANVINLGLSRIGGVFKASSKIKKLIKNLDADIIHSHGLRGDYFLTKIFDDIPKISTIHNYPPFDYIPRYGKIIGGLMAKFHLKTIRRKANNIACSKTVAKYFNLKANIEIEYIQNGVDTEFFKPIKNENEKEYYRQKLGLPFYKTIYICVGQLVNIKNMKTLVSVFNSLPENDVLIIVGEGKEKNQLLELINNKSKIKLVGNSDFVREYLYASDYFVSASTAEGLPNSVLEAMACGLPVILSDIEAHREIFYAFYPYFFKPKNTNDLVKQINIITKEDYRMLSQKAREIIERNFSAKIMAENYEKKYKDLVYQK